VHFTAACEQYHVAWKPQRVEPEQTGLHTYNLDNI
jgi:hypothetical protein